MDTSDPDITFDDRGECNHCRRYDERARNEVFHGEDARHRLEAIVAQIKLEGQGKEYDCVTGVSGGVDSTTVVLTLKRLGLRVLAVHLDNGWDSELAVDNIKKALTRLDVDLYTHVIDWEEFRDLQLAFLRASVPNAELPTDHGINALLFRAAIKHGSRFVIGGGNVATEAIMPSAWSYDSQDLRHLKAVHRRFGSGRLRTLPTMNMPEFLYSVLGRRLRIVPILNYTGYKKSEAVRVLQSELGWRPYEAKHYESVYTRFFQGYILPVKFGFDKRRAHYCCLIGSGDMTRAEALTALLEPAYSADRVQEDKTFVVKKLGLTPGEFEQIMQLPPRRHTDYPNHAMFFEKLTGLKAWFKRLATTV